MIASLDLGHVSNTSSIFFHLDCPFCKKTSESRKQSRNPSPTHHHDLDALTRTLMGNLWVTAYIPSRIIACMNTISSWMGSVTYDSWKSLKLSRATPKPRLELLRGPPTHYGSSLPDPQRFRLLPLAVSAGGGPLSPDGPSTCLGNAEVSLQARNVTWLVQQPKM